MMQHNPVFLLLLAAVVFLLSLFVTYLTYKISSAIGFVNNPNRIVENHKKPVAYGGGLAIALTLIVFLIYLEYSDLNKFIIIISVVLVTILGLTDDKISLRPLIKLILQAACILPFLIVSDMSFPLKTAAGIFILTSMNAWNLIDIMDGLAGTVSLFAFAGVSVYALGFSSFSADAGVISLIISSGVLGFLFWNFKPARIFLGDAGSLLLGMLFAVLVIEVIKNETITAAWPVVIPGAVPFFELLFLIVVRHKKGIPFYRGSPDHFALRMLHNGFEVRSIIFYVAVFSSLLLLFMVILFSIELYTGIAAGMFFLAFVYTSGYIYFNSLPAREAK